MRHISLLSALTVIMISCGNNATVEPITQPASETTPENSATPTIDTADIVSGATSVENNLTLNGTIEIPIHNQATISIPMDAIIRNVRLIEGQYVQKGEVVATLENPRFIELQQSYMDAVAQCEFLEAEYDRQKNLAQGDATSQRRLQQSKADFLSMKSRQEAAAAHLKILDITPQTIVSTGISSSLEIKSPISGYISNVSANQGKFLATGEAICEVVNKQSIILKLTAYEKDLNKITLGKSIGFRVNGLGNKVFEATITSIGQRVDMQNRSIEVYARSNHNETLFRPGMYVSARIEN